MSEKLPTLASSERRAFCGAACGAAAVAAVGLPAVGCGNQVDPAPYLDGALDEDPSSLTYGQVAVPIAEYPELARLGSAVTVRLKPTTATHDFFIPEHGVLVVHRNAVDSPDEFVAVQSLCPHAACPLGYSRADDLVACPCHASTFRAVADPAVDGSYQGQVLHLPARDDLAAWAITVTQGVLRVDFRQPLAGGASTATVVNGTVTIPVMMLPSLQQVGGSVIVAPKGLGDTLILVRRDAATVTTLSAICTHQACKVQYEPAKDDLLCPCHTSYFAMTGALVTGPAKAPLKLYPTDFDGTTIVVHVA